MDEVTNEAVLASLLRQEVLLEELLIRTVYPKGCTDEQREEIMRDVARDQYVWQNAYEKHAQKERLLLARRAAASGPRSDRRKERREPDPRE